MADETALLAAGMHAAATLDLPLNISGQQVHVPPGTVPEPPPVTEEQRTAMREMRERSARPEVEGVRRIAFCMHMAGILLAPIVDALTDGTAAANSNTSSKDDAS